MPVRTYTAFGLTVASDLALAGFVATEPTVPPDVVVRTGPVEAGHDGAQHVGARADGVLSATIRDGRDLLVEVSPAADPKYASAVITGELFSVVLRQRGLLVLHGSAVARDGVAIGFVGDSGWGKSTLAATLIKRGWRLLTDDLLVVDHLGTDRTPTAIPTHPMMRLSREAAERLDEGEGRGQAHAQTPKLRVDHQAAFSKAPAELSRIWVLDPRLADDHESVDLSPLQAVHELVRHTRGKRLLVSDPFKASLLNQCADLVKRTPVQALRRRFGLEHVPSLCDFVESNIARST
ncbi:hypothetical protein [Rubrivirga sp.]|uniref:hypothetical protein n=1 Tax=Rubrivirga sp. TaxID=1885344 RepID=UPI003C720D35